MSANTLDINDWIRYLGHSVLDAFLLAVANVTQWGNRDGGLGFCCWLF